MPASHSLCLMLRECLLFRSAPLSDRIDRLTAILAAPSEQLQHSPP